VLPPIKDVPPVKERVELLMGAEVVGATAGKVVGKSTTAVPDTKLDETDPKRNSAGSDSESGGITIADVGTLAGAAKVSTGAKIAKQTKEINLASATIGDLIFVIIIARPVKM
jgi:hypothetical protein